MPDDPNSPYDMGGLVRRLLDDRNLFEVGPNFARNIITGFGRMEGRRAPHASPATAQDRRGGRDSWALSHLRTADLPRWRDRSAP